MPICKWSVHPTTIIRDSSLNLHRPSGRLLIYSGGRMQLVDKAKRTDRNHKTRVLPQSPK